MVTSISASDGNDFGAGKFFVLLLNLFTEVTCPLEMRAWLQITCVLLSGFDLTFPACTSMTSLSVTQIFTLKNLSWLQIAV